MPKVTFRPSRLVKNEVQVEVPDGTTILEASEENGLPVGSACGGVCACSTCHVYVLEGASRVSDMEDAESDRLDLAFDVRGSSRLGCQARVHGDIVVQITTESLDTWENEHPGQQPAAAGADESKAQH